MALVSRLRFILAPLLVAASFGACAAMPNFDTLEVRLKIRPEQKQQFDITVGATKRALLMVGIVALQLKDKLTAELSKSSPDFRAFARANEDLIEQTRPLFKEAGEEWKKLYALLDDEQVEIAKAFLREHLGRLLQYIQ
jgi:hypothetical protein